MYAYYILEQKHKRRYSITPIIKHKQIDSTSNCIKIHYFRIHKKGAIHQCINCSISNTI